MTAPRQNQEERDEDTGTEAKQFDYGYWNSEGVCGMFVEGCVSRGYLQALQAAGYDIQEVVDNRRDAAELIDKGLDLPEPFDHDYGSDPWVRFYVDCGIEDFITPEQAVRYADEIQNLPLLVGNTDRGISDAVAERLKDGGSNESHQGSR